MLLNRKVSNILKDRQKELKKCLFLDNNEVLELSFYNFILGKKIDSLRLNFGVVSEKTGLIVSEKMFVINSDDTMFEQLKKICSILEYIEKHYRYNVLIDNTCQYNYNTIYCNSLEITDVLKCFVNLLKKDITRTEATEIVLKMF